MENKTQHDIVAQHLQSLRIGEVLTDKLRFPNVEALFTIERPKKKDVEARTARLRLPLTSAINVTTRHEIVDAIIQCLQSGQDITGVQWNVGDDYVEVNRESGVTSELSVTEDQLHGVLMTVLRSRAVVTGFEWEFGKPFIKVSYENRQYA